ncbi:hypothetical protein V1517DRAFT_269636 [Lipomyces orientalis]|uniref:Uncharacterized protein n=1 Tax=Lipomyces orientalis TaxID=1233043 RepID=A0ACC3TXY0_9ASCO
MMELASRSLSTSSNATEADPASRSRSLSPASHAPLRSLAVPRRALSYGAMGSPLRSPSTTTADGIGWTRGRHVNVILELDLNCNIIWGSRSWANVMGVDIQDLIGKPISEVLVGNEDVFQKATDAMLETNSSYHVRFTTYRGELAQDADEQEAAVVGTEMSTPSSTAVTSRTNSTYASANNSRRNSMIREEDERAGPDAMVTPKTSPAKVILAGSSTTIVTPLAAPAPASPSIAAQRESVGASSPRKPSSGVQESRGDRSETTPPHNNTLEMEGQGIIIFDRHTLDPCYSMWVLKPYFEPLRPVVDLPQTLVDSLGFGADVLASYISRLSQTGVTDPKDFPMQDQIMCRICERQIQPWWFERHSELCLVEHKAESDVQPCQDNLREHRARLFAILEQLEGQANHDGVVEYRGMPVAPPPLHRSGSSQRFPMSLSHLKHLGKYRSPVRTVEMLLDLCDMSLMVNTPALRDSNRTTDEEGGYEIRVHSPESESRLKQVLTWHAPSNVEDEGLALLCRDTERIAKSKIEAILRLGNTITYSEKIQRELSVLVNETIEEAVSQIIQQQADDADQSGDDDLASDAGDLGFFSGYLSQQFRDEFGDEQVVSPSPGGYNSGTVSVASGSSPHETMTPKSLFASLSRPRSRKLKVRDEEGMDSDSSRSSVVYLREKADSPVSEPEMPSRNIWTRKSSASFLFGSPHRQKSPSISFSKSPLQTQKLKFSSMADNGSSSHSNTSSTTAHTDSINNISFTPLTSPLLFPIDSYPEIGRHHRRKSSAASDFSKGPVSPLLSSVNPAVRPAQPSIKDFEVIKPISRGAFGSVYLTKKKNTGDYFAIKVLKKSDMIAKNQVTNVKAERAIMMAQAESPFVAKLFFTFQSKEYLYLVMEYLNGGDCAALLKAFGGGLPEDWAKKYVAEVVLGIENLHEQGIVHRDLKPDNLLIDKDGHLKLTDFGLSRMGLVGRQARARNASTIDPPDIFQQGQFGSRSMSVSAQQPGALDTPMYVDNNLGLGISPGSTPVMQPADSGALLNVPGYFSLNKSALSEPYPKPLSLSSSFPKKGESINSMLSSFTLTNPMSASPRLAGKDREDDAQSATSSVSSDVSGITGLGLQQMNSHNNSGSVSVSASASASGSGSTATSSSMPPPPTPALQNMALFDPANDGKKFVGTPDYLAPETIMGTGQDEMSDWWSLGCIVFEFLYGYPPFHADTPNEVFENILARKIAWPSPEEVQSVSREAIDLIEKLICTDPEKRLGAETSDQVKRHPFFEGITWESLCEEEASFIPQPLHDEDTAYFDDRGAILQTFPEEENEDSDAKRDDKHHDHLGTRSSGQSSRQDSSSEASSRKGSFGSAASGTTAPTTSSTRSVKLLPLHIPHHFRGRRMRRLSEPVPADDFGSFSFKNLNVLEKANKDVIQRLKSEHLEQMKSPVSPAQPSGLVEPSPVKPRNASVGSLGAAISLNYGKRPGSPSSSSSGNSTFFRNVSPSRNLAHLSIPSSPLTTSVPISAPYDTDEDREQSSSSSSAVSRQSGSPINSRKVSTSSFK